MRSVLLDNFTGIILFFYMILCDLSYLNSSVYAVPYNSSEEIKNIFKPSHDTNFILKGTAVRENFAEGGLVESFTPSKSNISIHNYAQNLSTSHKNVPTLTSLLNKENVSLSSNNSTNNYSHNTLLSSSIQTLSPTKLIETGSNLFLGVPEVIHINGTSSIKPRKGVHYSKIVPHKGVENENEAFHISLENHSCFWLSERECYSNEEMHDLKCSCCKEDNVLGKNVKQTPINCNNCKTFDILASEGNQTCRNICCNAINNDFYSVSSTQSSYNDYKNYQTVSSTNNGQHDLSNKEISEKINLKNGSSKTIVTKENYNSVAVKKNSKLKPQITKVPYDTESMTAILGKAQQKVFVPLAVSLFLLPLLGIIIFFLWQRTKEYLNKRYYKRMDFLIDGIYND